jgi:hypothetical protein
MMNDPPIITAYVDLSVLSVFARGIGESGEDGQAAARIWEHFLNNRIDLVTSEEDTKMDIILYLNNEGCCVTDTLVAIEAIHEFERWGKINRGRTEAYRRLFEYFDRLRVLPGFVESRADSLFSGSEEETLTRIRAIVSSPERSEKRSHGPENSFESEYRILGECLKDLNRWYTDESWHNLRKTDYQLNWDILESVLLSPEEELSGPARSRERTGRIFGLLNRAVGLSKKSCGKLPMPEGHIAFVIKTVTQKYNYRRDERIALHILHCIRHGIPFFISTDADLIQRYSQRRHLLKEDHPLPGREGPDLLSPARFAEKLVEGLKS